MKPFPPHLEQQHFQAPHAMHFGAWEGMKQQHYGTPIQSDFYQQQWGENCRDENFANASYSENDSTPLESPFGGGFSVNDPCTGTFFSDSSQRARGN